MSANLAARLAADMHRETALHTHSWRAGPHGGMWCARLWCAAAWPIGQDEPHGPCPDREPQ